MRICRFGNSYGMVCGDTVIDITTHVNNAEIPGYGDALIRALPGLRGRDRELQSGSIRLPLSDVALLSPVRNPTKILAAPNNYREHSAEMIVSYFRIAGLGSIKSTHTQGYCPSAAGPAVLIVLDLVGVIWPNSQWLALQAIRSLPPSRWPGRH